jgi:hypothetical protein
MSKLEKVIGKPLGRRSALLLVASGVALIAAGWLTYDSNVAFDRDAMIKIELGGSEQVFAPGPGFNHALQWDGAFILGYAAGLALLLYVGRQVFWHPGAKTIARAGIGAAIGAGLADVVEDVGLWRANHGHGTWWLDLAAGSASVKFSLLLVAVPVAAVAVVLTVSRVVRTSVAERALSDVAKARAAHEAALVTERAAEHAAEGAENAREAMKQALARTVAAGRKGTAAGQKTAVELARQAHEASVKLAEATRADAAGAASATEVAAAGVARLEAPAGGEPATRDRFAKLLAPELFAKAAALPSDLEPVNEGDPQGRWRRGYRLGGGITPDPKATGFCVSGGGIRSGSVALGALQALRGPLTKARYLVSVSGGGYTAGAMQLALNDLSNDDETLATARDVFGEGSPEEDYTRRHSSYIADGFHQWVLALAVVLRGLLASVALIGLVMATAGLTLGLVYHQLPLADLSHVKPGNQPSYPDVREPVVWALGVIAAFGALAFVLSIVIPLEWAKLSHGSRRTAKAAASLEVLLAATGVGIPALIWGSAALLSQPRTKPGPTASAGAGGTVLLSYLGALVGIAWRQRAAVGKQLGRFGSKRKEGENGSTAVPKGIVTRLVVMVVLVVVGTAFLIELGALAAYSAAADKDGRLTSDWPRCALLGCVVALVVVGGFVDQTWLGLHPFYRRRLASAYAVRRLLRPGGVEAVPYDYDKESTPLHEYAQRHPKHKAPDFPELILCGAANVSGQDLTPPGRRAVSYTMSAEYLGGPDIGYVKTAEVYEEVSRPLQRDLTLQAAMAISGAAFASAMGRQARPYQVLLALTNARLGTWLPNPSSYDNASDATDWNRPSMPRIRRVTYLLREIVGSHSPKDRLLHVTDGGHYDNLGLVELLRRRCATIVCIDSSNDTPPFASTLADAMDLAHDELGVTFEFVGDQFATAPGTGEPLDPQGVFAALSGRLSKSHLLTIKATYPTELALAGPPTCVIHFAKAVLTHDLPYALLSHAQQSPTFPRDSTGDQWFSHAQFDAYTALGRHLGEQLLPLLPSTTAGP